MDQKTLNEILNKHSSWLQNEPGGARADLRVANLHKANLDGADLRGANLDGADLRVANLHGADLRVANLHKANLYGANLRGADLYGANLYGANLYGADLRGANLDGADLRGANLDGANFRGAKNVPCIPMACPDTGAFIAWKKAYDEDAYLVKLLIPEDARRSSATGRKCRADKAVVLSIEPIVAGGVVPEVVHSKRDTSFTYKVGQTVVAPDFDTDRFNECAPGIHFFINKQEAIDYYF